MLVVFGKHTAKRNSAFIMLAASETDNHKFRIILSWKVTDGFKICKQYKGLLRLVTKTVESTGALASRGGAVAPAPSSGGAAPAA